MRTAGEQVQVVKQRLLRAHPEFKSLQAHTKIADGILVDMCGWFKDAPEGPFIRILTLWTRWKADLGLGQRGGYDTFVTYVAREEQREKADGTSR